MGYRNEQIKARLSAITQGEWKFIKSPIGNAPEVIVNQVNKLGVVSRKIARFLLEMGSEGITEANANAEFIANAPADVDYLLKDAEFTHQEFTEFIDQVWQIAREGTMGDWDYRDQVLRHLKERIAELKGEKQPVNLLKSE